MLCYVLTIFNAFFNDDLTIKTKAAIENKFIEAEPDVSIETVIPVKYVNQ